MNELGLVIWEGASRVAVFRIALRDGESQY